MSNFSRCKKPSSIYRHAYLSTKTDFYLYRSSCSNPDEAQNPKPLFDTTQADKATGTNTSDSDVSETKGQPITSTIHFKSEETTNPNISSNSNNQEGTTAPNTSDGLAESNVINNVSASSASNGSQEKTKMDTVSPDKQSGELVEPTSPINPKNVEGNDILSTTSDHEKLEETKKPNASPVDSDVTRTGDSIPPQDDNEPERRNNEDTSCKGNSTNKKTDANNTSGVDRSHRSTVSNISYYSGEPDLLEPILANATNKNLIDRLLGCAYGQALGDAYGLSTEFEDREDVARNYPDKNKLIPFPDYVKTGHNRRWNTGDWTDDTDQWILILDTLMYHNGDEKAFAEKLTNWIRYGYPELGDHGGMGLGANVSQVVRSYNYLNDPLMVSEMVWERGNRQAAPNGAVMRCSASAFVHFNDPEKVKSTAILMCKTTHFDPQCISSCLAVCLAITYLLREDVISNDIESLIKRVQLETIETIGENFSEEHRKLFEWFTDTRTLEELDLDEPRSIGYTYKCLASGFYGLRSTRPFEETLNDLIRYGGDADTNGAVCGTMYGARYGYRALPFEWLKAMPNKKWLDQKIIKCLEKMNLIENQAMDTS